MGTTNGIGPTVPVDLGTGHGTPLMIPYPAGHGSGHAGNATSRERQLREDATGLTATRQAKALEAVELAARRGITVAELEEYLGIGHGQASSALSHLHRAGRIKRITARRKSQEIYVAEEYRDGRDESPYNARSARKHPKFHSDRTVVEAMSMAGLPLDEQSYDAIRKFLENLP